SGSYGGSSSSGADWSYDSGATAHDAGRAEASVGDGDASETVDAGGGVTTDAGASSSGSGSGSSSGGGSGGDDSDAQASTGGGTCVPGSACGGLWECTDDCYGSKCCLLDCACTDPSGSSGTLDCSLTCP
ncbi:MAG TPA: hypothetical protein VHS09_17465, partial [Polyangiaceae bacterium]|nr:hypothetical protein [Polyangiaceae bacterium]